MARRKPTIRDVDRGFRDIVKSMAKAAGDKQTRLKVGWPGDKGAAIHQKNGHMTVADLAMVHEFGSRDGRCPERSMIRATFDLFEGKYLSMVRKIAADITRGKGTLRKGLHELGRSAKADIKARMRQGIPPPNAPSTLKRKSGITPLIDTRQLIGAVGYEVSRADR